MAFTPLHSSLPHWVGLTYVTNEDISVWILRLGHKRYCSFCLTPLDDLCWEKPIVMSWRHSRILTEVYKVRNSHQAAPTCQLSSKLVSYVERGFSKSSQAFSYLQPWPTCCLQHETLTQKHMARPPPNSWLTDIVKDTNCLLLYWATTFL